MKRFLVLVNPSSHGGRSGRRWKALSELLPEGEFILLKSIEEAGELARTAHGYETVVACGGDGTVRAVAEGVLENQDDSLKFGVLYTGTSPDFCHAHGIPIELGAAIRLLRSGAFREIPVLTANGRAFFCSLNLGIGAAVAETANRLRPYLGDHVGTFAALVSALLRARSYGVEVGDWRIDACAHFLITRIPAIAGGLRLALPKLGEDEFAAWVVRRPALLDWPRLLWSLYKGEPCGEFHILRNAVTLRSDAAVPVEFDGDPHGCLPVEVRFSKQRLKLVRP